MNYSVKECSLFVSNDHNDELQAGQKHLLGVWNYLYY